MKLEEIEKLCNEATSGPWLSNVCHDRTHHGCGSDIPYDDDELFVEQCHKDGKFIAASRMLIPKLLAIAKAARKLSWVDDRLSESTPLYMEIENLETALDNLEKE